MHRDLRRVAASFGSMEGGLDGSQPLSPGRCWASPPRTPRTTEHDIKRQHSEAKRPRGTLMSSCASARRRRRGELPVLSLAYELPRASISRMVRQKAEVSLQMSPPTMASIPAETSVGPGAEILSLRDMLSPYQMEDPPQLDLGPSVVTERPIPRRPA